MKKYFYTDGLTNFGPFTLEELRDHHITRETPIWFQELGDWKKAGMIPELNELFASIPPPITTAPPVYNNYNNTGTANPYTSQVPPKTYLLESILVTLFCCLPFGIAGIVNASNVESRFYLSDIDGARRASLAAKKWTTIGFWIGIASISLYLIGIFTIGLGAAGFGVLS